MKEYVNFAEPVEQLKEDLNNILDKYYKKYLDKYLKIGYMYKMNLKDFFNLQYRLGYENIVDMCIKKKIYLYCESYNSLLEVNIVDKNVVYVKEFIIKSIQLNTYKEWYCKNISKQEQ